MRPSCVAGLPYTGRVFFGCVAVIRWLPVVARRTVCLPHVLPPAKYFHPHSAAASSHAIQSVIDRARAARRLRLTLLLIFSSVQFAQTASAQSVATDTPQPVAERGPLSVGFYAGELYKSEYISILYRPQDIQLSPSYLVAANVDYRIYKSADIPIQFEGEFDIAKRFHGADEFDVVLAPFVRWTWFPWNRFLYTNVRVGALGLSYTSGVSTWERQNSGNNRGSNFLQFGAMEVSFAAHENARSEVFVRVHHRSGIFGLINGVNGGSNYLSFGFRIFL